MSDRYIEEKNIEIVKIYPEKGLNPLFCVKRNLIQQYYIRANNAYEYRLPI